MKRLRSFLLTVALLASIAASGQTDSVAALTGNWYQQLRQANYNINDPRIHYPRFVNFCRNVYNWYDRVFDTYDSTYVVSTHKNWKFILDSTSQMQRYGYLFDIQSINNASLVSVRSNLNYDLGFNLSFMAISIGYTLNTNRLIGQSTSPRSTFGLEFTCSRFSIEYLQHNFKGNTYIDRFAQYNDGRRVYIPLDNTRNKQLLIDGYYFFNYDKYSQAAAYSFTKYQVRSAGSWLLGARYAQQKLMLDFSNLDAEVLAFKPTTLGLINQYDFHEICAQAGYAYNFALPHNWLINLTGLPGIGYRRSIIMARQSRAQMVALNLDGRLSIVYNHRAFFANFQARASGILLANRAYFFLMASEQFAVNVGVRF